MFKNLVIFISLLFFTVFYIEQFLRLGTYRRYNYVCLFTVNYF